MTLTVDIDKHPRIKLKARHTLNGNLMVLDHEDIDIVLNLESKKCICFPKEHLSDRTYLAQDRMFKFLSKKGVIDHSSIRGGNVHGSLEGTILESKIPGVDQTQACLFAISQFLNDEKHAQRINEMLEQKKLLITPLAYIRGRSIQKSFFIVDEAQNLTPHEVKTIITRAGEGTKIVFTGDIYQIDHPYLDKKSNGLTYLISKMQGQSVFAHITLEKGERSDLAELASNLL